ncbi:methionyl-tRNA formyltransferase [Pseudoalteromonas sp. PPB1]|uniref:methionyl-tRNA formyltransferase n=1 Tax=Pseudoalteromonas sp. PPB1 TaxID=2756136 RepID=UPI0018915F30|nr:formyltransferase family protein [Pseudoalteromonas sp. PPB1]
MEVKYALFSGSCLCLTAVQYLLQRGQLSCVVLIEAEPNPDLVQLQRFLHHHQIPMLQYKTESDDALIADLDRLGANSGIAYLFKHKLRAKLIDFFAGDVLNIHPSALPDYRGPMPVFWQLKSGADTVRLTLHKVAEQLDTGDIATHIDLPVHPFDTSQCFHQKIAQAVPALLEQFAQQQAAGTLNWQEQKEYIEMDGEQCEPRYAAHVQVEDLLIDWRRHTSIEIVNLARAANAELGGARFKFREGMLQLMQASTMECKLAGIKPGTILELDRIKGLLVKTVDGAIRLDTILTEQGIFDGYRFAVLFGLEPGLEVAASSEGRM